MDFPDLLSMFNDGVSDSGILFILVLVDTCLAISYQIKSGNKLLSNKLLSGLLRNITLCFMPALVHALSVWHPRSDQVYPVIAAVLSVYIGYAILQSILAYTEMWGIKYPEWLNKWLENEIKDKEKKTGMNDDSDKDKDNKDEKSKQCYNGSRGDNICYRTIQITLKQKVL